MRSLPYDWIASIRHRPFLSCLTLASKDKMTFILLGWFRCYVYACMSCMRLHFLLGDLWILMQVGVGLYENVVWIAEVMVCIYV